MKRSYLPWSLPAELGANGQIDKCSLIAQWAGRLIDAEDEVLGPAGEIEIGARVGPLAGTHHKLTTSA
jgi:hypothetical protein